jgi:hypothetical protein
MEINPQDVTAYTIGGFAISGTALWLIRWVVRTFHVDRLAIKSTNAEGTVIDRLQSEISRLEVVITGQTKTIADMQRYQRKLDKRLSNQRAVLIAIETIVEGMCSCDTNARKKLAELIGELITDDSYADDEELKN